jgi:hypothetical protein
MVGHRKPMHKTIAHSCARFPNDNAYILGLVGAVGGNDQLVYSDLVSRIAQ